MVKLRLVTGDDQPGASAAPLPSECVACFVDRMTQAHGCSNDLTWAALWRDHCAPRATALERKLRSKGGYCDCEVLLNVHVRPHVLRERWAVAAEPAEDEPDVGPSRCLPSRCLGVRRGSTRSCGRWVPPS